MTPDGVYIRMIVLGRYFGHFYDQILASYLSYYGQFPIPNRHLPYIPMLLSLKDLVPILWGKIVVLALFIQRLF